MNVGGHTNGRNGRGRGNGQSAPMVLDMDDDSGVGSMAISLSRAEIDQQIATAHRFPRSIEMAVKNFASLATLDEESAAECTYAVPRDGKVITGPSVRFAEIIASQWRNSRIAARVVHTDFVEKFIEAEAVFHDLETNVATLQRVRRRISTKSGGVYSPDMIATTGNAACSIALRNAILKGVPKPVWRKAYEHSVKVAQGSAETLSKTRIAAVRSFDAFKVGEAKVLAKLGLQGLADVTLQHVGQLRSMYTSIKSGEVTAEAMFAEPEQEAKVSEPPAAPPPAPKEEPPAPAEPEAASAPEEEPFPGDLPSPSAPPPPVALPYGARSFLRKVEAAYAAAEDIDALNNLRMQHEDAVIHHSVAAQEQELYDIAEKRITD